MLTQEDLECLQDITRMYDGTQEGNRQGRVRYKAAVADREELQQQLAEANAEIADLLAAIARARGEEP